MENRQVFLCLLADPDAGKSVPVIENYFLSLQVQEYFDEVNYFLIEKYGENLFLMISAVCMKRFIQWQGLKRIEAHFGNSKQFRFWASFADKMTKVIQDDQSGVLFMDFGSFVAADVPETRAEDELSEPFSYIYDKRYFEDSLDWYAQAHKDSPASWRIIPEHVADVREKIIMDIKSEAYRMGYERVGLLYSKEIIRGLLEGKIYFL